jgi:hypothetical protein
MFLNNQLGRRNLAELQKSYLRGLQYKRERKKITNPEGKNQHSEVKCQNETQPNETGRDTAKRLGDQHKVSRSTIQRDVQLV